ncbi:MAG: glycosyltransferase [Clostridia bacterium]|nr:glycosyltransferase [Clostridia bacterium]
MKILIIAYFFPQTNTIGALRPYSWAKYFSSQGHDVTVATVKNREKPDDLDYDLSKFTVISEPLTLKHNTSEHNSYNQDSQCSSKKASLYSRIYASLKKTVFDFSTKTGILYGCRYPDFRLGWVNRLYKRLKNEQFDVVISTGCPYIVHSVAYKLRQDKDFFWVIDWRDLWTNNSAAKGLKVFHSYERKLERKYHSACDLVTTVSEGLRDELTKITDKRVEVIYNGFDPEEYTVITDNPRKDNPKIVISYLGSIYKGSRDPEPLFAALAELISEHKINEAEFELNFAGPNTDVKDLAQKYKLDNSYHFLGKLSRRESLQLQYDSDILLFLESEHKTKGILTGKLFEYISLGREIVAIGITGNNDAGKLIEASGIGFCLGTDIEKIKKWVLEHFENKCGVKVSDYSAVNKFTREVQAEQLLRRIADSIKLI